jgi:hypothetical protein
MWCQFFTPDTFLDQTAAIFAASLRGRVKDRELQAEQDTVLAWKIGAFSAAAQNGKLKKLDHYLAKKPVRQQTAEEMLAVLQEFKDRGVPMNIRRVN